MDLELILQRIVILAPPILFAVTVHETAHGWVAARLGDPTARMMGRLTLNPFRHLDPVGTLVFFLTQTIGWAKPVPVNPQFFERPRKDMIWVALAGPGANFLLAALSAVALRQGAGLLEPFAQSAESVVRPLVFMAYASVQINIGLAVFNLLPVPPLDGSKVLAGVLPHGWARYYVRMEQYGFLLILVLVFTGMTGRIIVPLVLYLDRLLLGTMP